MTIANISKRGGNFYGLFAYLLDKSKQAEIIGGNVEGKNIRALSLEFSRCAQRRTRTQKPVKHISLGFAPADGRVAKESKIKVAEKIVFSLGYTNNQWIAIDHDREDPRHDRSHDHDHIHIVINAIDLSGSRTDDSFDKKRLEKILRQVEIEENLTIVASSNEKKNKAPTHGQYQKYRRESSQFERQERITPPEIPVTLKLQAAIDTCSKDKPTMTAFIGRLQHLGIDVRPYISDKGRKRISYELEGVACRGSKLHNGSFPKLIEERGIDFKLDRDAEAMEAAMQGEKLDMEKINIDWSQIDLNYYSPQTKNEVELKSTSQSKEIEEKLYYLTEIEFENREKIKNRSLGSN
jgi:hypothetical protein